MKTAFWRQYKIPVFIQLHTATKTTKSIMILVPGTFNTDKTIEGTHYEDSYARAPRSGHCSRDGSDARLPGLERNQKIHRSGSREESRTVPRAGAQSRHRGPVRGSPAGVGGDEPYPPYKNEMEAQLRSPGCAGVNWLSMQRTSPDRVSSSAGSTRSTNPRASTPRQFRRYSAATVPLARFKTFVWTSDETFSARVQVSHWGERTVSNAKVAWTLRDPTGRVHAAGTFGPATLQPGSVSTLGEIACSLATFNNPTRLNLEIAIKGNPAPPTTGTPGSFHPRLLRPDQQTSSSATRRRLS